MPSAIQKWDYTKIQNFPKHATIQKCHGHLYVITREYCYDKDLKRGRESNRKIIGQVVDNVYYSREEYRQKFQKGMKPRRVPVVPRADSLPTPEAFKLLSNEQLLEFLQAEIIELTLGIIPIFHKVLCDIGMIEDLKSCYGDEIANIIFCLACFHASSSVKAHRHFSEWVNGRYIPPCSSITDRDVSRILKQIGENKELLNKLFACRVIRNMKVGKMYLSVDSTTVAWDAKESDCARWGHGKEGASQNQIGIAVTFNSTTGQPVLFRRLPGNFSDMKTALDFFTRLDEYNIQEICQAAFDRGYYSIENVVTAIDNNSKAIFAAPINSDFIKESIERARPILSDFSNGNENNDTYLKDGKIQAATIQRRIKVEGERKTVYVHVFRSRKFAADDRAKLYEELNIFEDTWLARPTMTKTLRKNPLMKFYNIIKNEDGSELIQRDNKTIEDELLYSGFFVDVTTWKCTAQECYDSYKLRSDIERIFRSGKGNGGLNVHRVHNDMTSNGKCVVLFVSLCLMEEIKRRLSKNVTKKLNGGTEHLEVVRNSYDWDKVLFGLASIQCLKRKSSGELLMREVSEEQQRMAVACGCKGIYDSVYTY